MLDNLINWYYPESLEEALSLLKKNEVIPHAGGTTILRAGNKRIRGLADLGRLPLKSLSEDKQYYYIGSCATFHQSATWGALTGPATIIRQAAGMAASTQLRNRITIGGSIAAPPVWSDLPPVLLALDAEIETIGTVKGWFPARQFFRKSPLDGTSLITMVRVPKLAGQAVFERVTRTRFDYSLLDLACYMSIIDGTIDKMRIAIGCAVAKTVRLTEVEDMLIGEKPSEELFNETIEKLTFQPLKDRRISKSYKIALLKILLKRSLNQLPNFNSISRL